MDEKKQQLNQQIINLQCDLSSFASPIGDWKVSKIYEYRMLGLQDPYDFEELAAKRQAVRDQINKLQEELKALEND